MIENISCQDFSQSIRKICTKGDKKRVVVTLGDGSYIVRATLTFGGLHCHVLIGNYSSIAHGIEFIIGTNHYQGCVGTYPFRNIYAPGTPWMIHNHHGIINHNQVIIGNDVWIGAHVTILGGVRIGNGAVIGTGAVVAKDVPPYAVVVGNPARVVKYRFSPEIIDSLQRIKWWNWGSERIKQCWHEFENTEEFLQKYAASIPVEPEIGNPDMYLALQELRKEDYKVYYFQPDLSSEDRIWQNVLDNILSDCYGEKSIFVVAVDEAERFKKSGKEFFARCYEFKKDCLILVDKSNAAGLVKAVDCIITTKEHESLQLIDMAGSDCQIIYGFDKT